jgi:hypothetical protein
VRDGFDDAAFEQGRSSVGGDADETDHHSALARCVLAGGWIREPALCSENETPVPETRLKRAGLRQCTVVRIEEDVRRKQRTGFMSFGNFDAWKRTQARDECRLPRRLRKPRSANDYTNRTDGSH